MPVPTKPALPVELPRGDTQPEGDPLHHPEAEDDEDDADMDRFMPGEESVIRKERGE